MAIMDCQTQKYSTQAAAASSDLQTVQTTIAVNYHLDPMTATRMYREVGPDYANRLIVPAVQEATKASTARFTAVELITDRNAMKLMIQDELSKRLLTYGLTVETISIENFDFSASFNAAIEAKVTAEQQALTAQRKLEQIKYEAEQAVAAANGAAEAKLTVATAEAKAIQIQGEALRENQEIVSLRAVEKWNGQLPTMMLGSGTVPFVNLPTPTPTPSS
jgi:regulator of protease activity HflC (stomatin/prohibitin superfamily)